MKTWPVNWFWPKSHKLFTFWGRGAFPWAGHVTGNTEIFFSALHMYMLINRMHNTCIFLKLHYSGISCTCSPSTVWWWFSLEMASNLTVVNWISSTALRIGNRIRLVNLSQLLLQTTVTHNINTYSGLNLPFTKYNGPVDSHRCRKIGRIEGGMTRHAPVTDHIRKTRFWHCHIV